MNDTATALPLEPAPLPEPSVASTPVASAPPGPVSPSALAEALNAPPAPDIRVKVQAPPLAPSLRNIPVDTRFVLGHARLVVGDLMDLARDRIIPIERGLSEPLDMEVNGTLVARAELLETDGGGLSVRIVEVIGAASGSDG
ncbi:FliM/FliN family flagellar motor switch protein [Rhizobiaceae bacterium]|nr:FliM/FliN family flagellar motor switch protein [Rhizobiaceae bacterium]